MKINSRFFLVVFTGTFFSFAGFAQEPIIADGEQLTLLADDFKFTEGPAADEQGNVFFTDQPNNRILKWNAEDHNISVFMEDAGRANGLYFDNEGNLIACADEYSELWEIDKNKDVNLLVRDYRGQRLNGPNDVWVNPDGGIYFTDPYYQRDYWERTEREIFEERVYYLSPDGLNFRFVADGFVKPNGIIGTPDGTILYVSDIGADITYYYTIANDGNLTDRKVFTNLGSDGMTIDNMGNIYLTGKGVTVFNKEGKQIAHIEVPENWTANVTFGGKENQTLFITAMDSVYILKMNVKGAN